jgi:translation initiation factor IF-2
MTDDKKKTLDQGSRKPLKLDISSISTEDKKNVRQNLSHGRSKSVSVEVKKNRLRSSRGGAEGSADFGKLTNQEQSQRMKALQEAAQRSLEKAKEAEAALIKAQEDEAKAEALREEEKKRKRAEEELPAAPEEKRKETEMGMSNSIKSVSSSKKREDYSHHTEKSGFSKTPPEVLPYAAVEKAKESAAPQRGALKPAVKSKKMLDDEAEELLKKRSKTPPKKKTKTAAEEALEEEMNKGPVLGLKKLRKYKKTKANQKVHRVILSGDLSVKDLAVKISEKSDVLLKKLTKMGVSDAKDSSFILESSLAELLLSEMGHESILAIAKSPLDMALIQRSDETGDKTSRPPVVTVMGHVDHGKTSLLDALRRTDVVSKEAGGITQHIGAYQVTLSSGKKITFIDTPGHEAFSQIRARGANLTDIVILVVAADDSVNAQTVEAISHAKMAKVPIIVAINKIDKPNARPDNIRQQLLKHDMIVESLGGDVLDVEISALTRKNLDKLEEAILLQAEILELRATPDQRALGVVVDTHIKKGIGSVATVLIQNGQLKKGDIFYAGETFGRVRLMFDDKNKGVLLAPPSMPVEVSGFQETPKPGDLFLVMETEAQAKEIATFAKEQRIQKEQDIKKQPFSLAMQLKSAGVKEWSLILKADVQGSLEGLSHEINKIESDEVSTKIVHTAIGPVNESDVLLAKASDATILSFNNEILPAAKKLAEIEHVRILQHQVLYHAIDEIKKALSGFLAPDMKETELGQADVIQVFSSPKGIIAGSVVKKGLFRRGEKVRIFRNGKQIHEDVVRSLRHLKDDLKEIKQGYEFGLMIDDYSDFQVGDSLVCFSVESIARSIS